MITAMPPERRHPVLDVDLAEELAHEALLATGLTARADLWLATMLARACIWANHVTAAGDDDTYALALVRACKLELERRLIPRRLAELEHTYPDARDQRERRDWLEWRLGQIDHLHLPYAMTVPPVGWLTEVP